VQTAILQTVALCLSGSPFRYLPRSTPALHQIQTTSSAIAEIARDADDVDFSETAIQGHSRSSVVVPNDAAYMIFY